MKKTPADTAATEMNALQKNTLQNTLQNTYRSVINRAHSFPRTAELRVEPWNLGFYRGIEPRNLYFIRRIWTTFLHRKWHQISSVTSLFTLIFG